MNINQEIGMMVNFIVENSQSPREDIEAACNEIASYYNLPVSNVAYLANIHAFTLLSFSRQMSGKFRELQIM